MPCYNHRIKYYLPIPSWMNPSHSVLKFWQIHGQALMQRFEHFVVGKSCKWNTLPGEYRGFINSFKIDNLLRKSLLDWMSIAYGTTFIFKQLYIYTIRLILSTHNVMFYAQCNTIREQIRTSFTFMCEPYCSVLIHWMLPLRLLCMLVFGLT